MGFLQSELFSFKHLNFLLQESQFLHSFTDEEGMFRKENKDGNKEYKNNIRHKKGKKEDRSLKSPNQELNYDLQINIFLHQT